MGARNRPNSWWIRAFLLGGVLEALAIGLTGFVYPTGSSFGHFLPMIVTPLNGRIIGAIYLAGAVGLLVSALGRRAIDTRIFVWGFGFIAGSLLVVTFCYWDEMTVVRVPYGWVTSYIIDPLAAIAIVWVYRLVRPASPGRHALTPLFTLEAALLGVAALLLLFAPGALSAHWPWKINVVLARMYAMYFGGFALGAVLAAWERDAVARRAFTLSSSALGALIVVASLQHRDRFTGAGTWLWFGGFGLAAIAFALAFVWSSLGGERARGIGAMPEPAPREL